MSLSERELLLLRRAAGRDPSGYPVRDHDDIAFVAGTADERLCRGLVSRGLLEDAPRSELFPECVVFRATRAGALRAAPGLGSVAGADTLPGETP